MSLADTLHTLVTWTPYLAGGFLNNLLVSVLSVAIGTAIGTPLAFARRGHIPWLARVAGLMTTGARNVPTFVFLFYIAFILPTEIHVFGFAVPLPAWVKASLALSIAEVGFTSDNLSIAIRDWRAGDHGAALLFLTNWTSYLLVMVMTSSTASAIGVDDIVARCNIVISAIGNPQIMFAMYLYTMFWFFLFCLPLIRGIGWVKKRMLHRYA